MLSLSSFGNVMDELFGDINEKLRMVSITDSTMMRIVHSAMNNAHERVRSKEGVIERLNEISKFYELAVMQLEGCMKFVEDESSHEAEVLAGLLEIRNRLKGRLRESQLAIAQKDRELVERAESETRLRRALETKERELESLQAKLESAEERDRHRDRDFCALKNSVDQQVWNIRQKLDDDQGGEVGDEKVEQMGTDIDTLKETLDVAFNKMRSAIFLSEVALIEQQWRWGVERDTFCLLVRGLVCDLREMFESKDWKLQDWRFLVGFDEFWHGLVDEVEGLNGELNTVFGRCESGLLQAKPNTEEEVNRDENENYVTKMIKNHECIIRKKSVEAEELSMARREVMHENALSSCRRENELVSLKHRDRDAIVKLCDTNLVEEVPNKILRLEQELQDSNAENRLTEEIYAVLLEGLSEDLNFKLLECGMESQVWEGICTINLIEMKNQWDENIGDNNVESQIREEMYFLVLSEVFKDFGSSSALEIVESNKRVFDTEFLFREEIGCIVVDESFKTIVETASSALCRCEEAKLDEIDEYKKESLIKEEVFQIVALEAIKDAFFRRKVVDNQGNRFECDGFETENTNRSPSRKIEKATHKSTNDQETTCSLCGYFAEPLMIHDQEKATICLEQDREESSIGTYNVEGMKQLEHSDSVLKSVMGFFQVMVNFEQMVGEKLELNSLRLEEIYRHNLHPLIKIVSSLREQESLYRKAFARRCQNLHKAEIEVDLLGDQVDALLSLLHKIHTSLQNYSPILQQNVLVSELLFMIKKESKKINYSY